MVYDGSTYFSQTVGVTTTVPDKVPSVLPLGDVSNNEWYYDGNTLFHKDSSTNCPHHPGLHSFKLGNKIGLLLLPNGELHLFLDGKNSAKVASGLPVHKSLFGAVDVCWRCTKIKSEILSGELDGVCLCTCTYIQSPRGYTPEYTNDRMKWTLRYCNM